MCITGKEVRGNLIDSFKTLGIELKFRFDDDERHAHCDLDDSFKLDDYLELDDD